VCSTNLYEFCTNLYELRLVALLFGAVLKSSLHVAKSHHTDHRLDVGTGAEVDALCQLQTVSGLTRLNVTVVVDEAERYCSRRRGFPADD